MILCACLKIIRVGGGEAGVHFVKSKMLRTKKSLQNMWGKYVHKKSGQKLASHQFMCISSKQIQNLQKKYIKGHQLKKIIINSQKTFTVF